jgi:hypothetical protein
MARRNDRGHVPPPLACTDHLELRAVGHLTLGQSLGCQRLALWDENKRWLVSFREAHRSSDRFTNRPRAPKYCSEY